MFSSKKAPKDSSQENPPIIYRDSGMYNIQDLYQMGMISKLHEADKQFLEYFKNNKQDLNIDYAITYFVDAVTNHCNQLTVKPNSKTLDWIGIEILASLSNAIRCFHVLQSLKSVTPQAKVVIALRLYLFTSINLPDALEKLMLSLRGDTTKIELMKELLVNLAETNKSPEGKAIFAFITQKMTPEPEDKPSMRRGP